VSVSLLKVTPSLEYATYFVTEYSVWINNWFIGLLQLRTLREHNLYSACEGVLNKLAICMEDLVCQTHNRDNAKLPSLRLPFVNLAWKYSVALHCIL
jgi:hypothetical protein